ncbi:MAG TPA: HAD hydrolase family protein [Phycisphaerae bacterium]|nr:HAD hydrolase family protein [Phycisphaerae bacterium]
MKSHWRIIACDLDGTLIGWDHKINERDLAALRAARQAGFHVAICTGRNATECAGVIGSLKLAGPGVFVNGAMVSEMATGRSARCRFMPEALVAEAVDFFGSRGHAVLLLADDPAQRMPAYFMTEHGEPHRGTREWLLANRMHAERCDQPPASHSGRIVRLGIVADVAEGRALEREMAVRFGIGASHHSIYSPHYDVQVLEVFAAGVNKWTGIEALAEELGEDPRRVIAIGDDVNDLAMLRGATLSFAMASAVPEVQSAAKRMTGSPAECGVAQVVEALLAGVLEPVSDERRGDNVGRENENG